MQYIALDAHKQYTWARVELPDGTLIRETRIPHERGAIQGFLTSYEPGSPVAVETMGGWYWIVDEIERAGFRLHLVYARKAKLMVGQVNKTDKLDTRGLLQLQRTGTLPTVWIPSHDLRDLRELPRTRMVLVRQRTQVKNRIHATLAKYALALPCSDVFGKRGRRSSCRGSRSSPLRPPSPRCAFWHTSMPSPSASPTLSSGWPTSLRSMRRSRS